MKKLLFAACAMGALMFVACTQEGPSLVGTWNSEPVVKIDSAGSNRTTNFKFELKEDSTLASDLDIVQDLDQDGVKITMPFKVAYKGKWSTADGKLIVTPVDTTVHFELLADSMKMSFENKPEMEMFKDKLVKSLKESFDKEMGLEFSGEYLKPDTMAYTIEGDVLKLISKKDTITFKRFVAPEK